MTISESDYSVNAETCTGCNRCVSICPSFILESTSHGKARYIPERIKLCVTCGHCMAMCEPQALQVAGLEYGRDIIPLPATVLSEESLYAWLSTRRSVRSFRDQPVPADMLRKIIDFLATAPYGADTGNVHITAISDRDKVRSALPHLRKSYRQLEKLAKIAPFRWLLLNMMPAEQASTLKNFIFPHMAQGLYTGASEKDDISRNAPALLIFHAPKTAVEHTVDGHILLTYALIAAHAVGLGATAIGLIGPVINRTRELRELFQIPAGHEVIYAMIVGYPKTHFRHAIVRKRKNSRII